MKDEILLENIYEFQRQYQSDENNTSVEKKIKEFGLLKASIDENKKSELKFEFNVEVPEVQIYDQFGSHQCNIFAFLRVVKDVLRKSNELDVNGLDLSANYINFFDKFEKANVLINTLMEESDLSIEKINLYVNRYIGSYGTFHSCREIVNKYGLVPTEDMKEVDNKYDDFLTIELLRDKIKCDVLSLMDMKTKEEKRKKKKEFMYEVYQFLSRVYGNPPTEIDYRGSVMTPLEFKTRYIGDTLDDYVTATSFKKEVLLNSYAFIPNIYLNDVEEIVELPITKIKNAVVKQLKDGISVWFSSEESTMLDYDENVLDDELYNLNGLLNIRNVSKDKKILLDMINYDHAMCITGALVREKGVEQFKVDNSFGKHGKYKGQLIMTNSFFENCVITTIINKKYIDL